MTRSWKALAAAAVLACIAAPAMAGPSVLDNWATVAVPAPPEVKPVTVDSASTALLLLDITAALCPPRPRCVAMLPALSKLLADARAHNMLVVYSAGAQTPTSLPPDPHPAIAAK